MNFNDYQELTEETAIYPDEGTVGETCVPVGVAYTAMGLAGEAGEVSEKIKKAMREDDVQYLYDVLDEAGDVLWYWARFVDEISQVTDPAVDAEMVANANIDKLIDRRDRGVVTGEGDDR